MRRLSAATAYHRRRVAPSAPVTTEVERVAVRCENVTAEGAY